ncbi:MAG TPA: DUF3500 domain-containing protein [Candidatus Acidoferrum sp.]|nr:DUF3500 domain-containing protein [Candidatus Acidoferrum sp.]
MKRHSACTLMTALLLATFAIGQGLAQQTPPAPPKRPPAVLKQLSLDAEIPGLKEPFKGITTNGVIEPDLFHIHATGVSTNAVRDATDLFLASLTPEQRAKTVYDINNDEWRKWMNQSFYVRQGVSFDEMNAKQKEAAFNLLKAALSAKGLKQTRDIMRLNTTLAELTDGNFDEYGEGQYYITVMGKPDMKEPWGFQLDGHHAVINYFVLGDQVVMTPFFAGSEPVIAPSGKYKGTKVLQDEQNNAIAFVNGLDANQRKAAILKFDKTGDENLTEAWKDNVVLDYAGVKASALNDKQKQQLLALIQLYVGNMDDGHAKIKMDEVKAQLDRTYFAWIGKTEKDSVFYYRIHSPVVLIEFDHQRPVGLRHLYDPNLPYHEHIHTVVRTPNGNDYGKDLLRQHYAQQHATP